MRTALKAVIAAAVITLGLTTVAASPAMANAPAPYCESGASQFLCDADSTGTTTWSITWWGGSVGTFTTAGSTLFASCPYSSIGKQVRASYSYVSGGTTVYSDQSSFICRSGPWQ
ncbi:hypothetical protein F4553_007352 [Allocatelliglobosispora scoriae]|uniref:Ig-like domain-containing protein n=1 Tax=Allocatelliglobosispora scoriae TaxID=643052 RepID=A0A841C2C9_9ACTN|nr:hypothetical protein [Allocatelliglobosispora scoriae]MBB5873918.1 hypothetical protein [Allocatelliglobosispora scoriae]